MRICWIGPYLPVNGRSGSDLRSFHLIKGLKRSGHTLHGRFLDSHGHEAEQYFDHYQIVQITRPMKYLRSIMSGMLGTPFSFGRFYHPELWPTKGTYDWIYVDHLHMTTNLPGAPDVAVWLDEHNLEYRLWEEYSSTLPVYVRPAVDWEARRVFHYEMETLDSVDGFSLPSTREKQFLPDELKGRATVIGNGVDSAWLTKGEERLNTPLNRIETLGFIGSFDWRPNRLGIEKFLQQHWELLRTEYPGLTLELAGRNPDPTWSRREGVDTPGFVENVDRFFQRIDCLAVPVEIGAGTRVKVLEAMARGVPVRGTEKAVEGIRGASFLSAGDMYDLRVCLQNDIQDPDRLEQTRIRAYELVQNQFRWSDLSKKLNRMLQ